MDPQLKNFLNNLYLDEEIGCPEGTSWDTEQCKCLSEDSSGNIIARAWQGLVKLASGSSVQCPDPWIWDEELEMCVQEDMSGFIKHGNFVYDNDDDNDVESPTPTATPTATPTPTATATPTPTPTPLPNDNDNDVEYYEFTYNKVICGRLENLPSSYTVDPFDQVTFKYDILGVAPSYLSYGGSCLEFDSNTSEKLPSTAPDLPSILPSVDCGDAGFDLPTCLNDSDNDNDNDVESTPTPTATATPTPTPTATATPTPTPTPLPNDNDDCDLYCVNLPMGRDDCESQWLETERSRGYIGATYKISGVSDSACSHLIGLTGVDVYDTPANAAVADIGVGYIWTGTCRILSACSNDNDNDNDVEFTPTPTPIANKTFNTVHRTIAVMLVKYIN